MTFDWKNFFYLAQQLQTYNSTEVSKETVLRCAISRVYYAAFGIAKNYAVKYQKFEPTKTAGDHEKLIKHFDNQSYGKNTSRTLRDLRQKRNYCDYDDSEQKFEDMLKESIKLFMDLEKALVPRKQNP